MRWSALVTLASCLLPAIFWGGGPVVAAPPTPVASLPIPGADREQGGRMWVGFDPTGRFLAAYCGTFTEDSWTIWDVARRDPVHSSRVRSNKYTWRPEIGDPAVFLPSGSHLLVLTSNGDVDSIP